MSAKAAKNSVADSWYLWQFFPPDIDNCLDVPAFSQLTFGTTRH